MWQVTRDYTEAGILDDYEQVNVESSDFDLETWAILPKFRFRMFDDDGNLYYEGTSTDNNSEDAFDPLDDYGTPNAGCTTIKYWEKEHWVML